MCLGSSSSPESPAAGMASEGHAGKLRVLALNM
jgi:hypothetical protein